MKSSIVTRIESDRRLRIPDEWGEEFAAEHAVELELRDDGILVKPLAKTPLQAAAPERKVQMNQPSHLDLADLDMDSLGW